MVNLLFGREELTLCLDNLLRSNTSGVTGIGGRPLRFVRTFSTLSIMREKQILESYVALTLKHAMNTKHLAHLKSLNTNALLNYFCIQLNLEAKEIYRCNYAKKSFSL